MKRWLLLLSCLAVLPAFAQTNGLTVAAPSEQNLRDATTPMPRREKRWQQRHAEFVEQAKAGGIDVLFVGDSITDFWRSAGKETWATEYAPLKAANFGISADMTQFVLWRLQNGELDGVHPKVVVLMIGTNNLKSGPTRMAPADAVAGIEAVLKTIREKLPEAKVLLLAILPRQTTQYPWMPATVSETNELLAKLADGQTVRFFDFGTKFLTADGKVNKGLMPDELHPNAAGYKVWADAMRPVLSEMLKQ